MHTREADGAGKPNPKPNPKPLSPIVRDIPRAVLGIFVQVGALLGALDALSLAASTVV